jgi:hypothetical protein
MDKIKQIIEGNRGKDAFVILTVILVGLGAFGLGHLDQKNKPIDDNVTDSNPTTNIITASDIISPATPVNTISQTTTTTNTPTITKTSKPIVGSTSSIDKAFVASKIGHKYYPINCSAGKSIKSENKIYFTTEAEAETAGYTKSTSCK